MAPRPQSETARQRELYKYWQPNESVFPSAHYDESFNHDYQPRPSYDSALTAYAQLGALRCNAKRGMISVVDQSFQYIIAEGTKTLSLQDGTVVDPDDELWFGLRTIPRQMGICATALGQFTTAEANDGSVSDTLFQPLQFIIPDLSKDPRFTNQPFVCGVPYLRFYAGVPIRSPAGYIIGIYSIVDDKPRENFGEKDLDVLKDLAATVMDHLVLGTVRGRHHRADRMVKGLGLFVEGKATLRDWWLRSGYLAKGPTTKDGSRGEWTLKAQADAEFGPQREDTSNNHAPGQRTRISYHRAPRQQNGLLLKPAKGTTSERTPLFPSSTGAPSGETVVSNLTLPISESSSQNIIQESLVGLVNASTLEPMPESSLGPSPLQNVMLSDSIKLDDEDSSKDPKTELLSMSQEIRFMLTRASNLIRESITVEGCLFLDASPAAYKDPPSAPGVEKREPSIPKRSTSSERSSEIEDAGIALDISTDGAGRKSSSSQPESAPASMCEVLGCSLEFDPHLSGSETGANFRFPQDFLHRLFNNYPNGGILNFEEGGRFSSSDDDIKNNSVDSFSTHEGSPRPRRKKTKSSLKKLDAKIILGAFPGIRCLAFFPLWDSSINSWFCGSFAWTKDPLRILDPADDVAYLAAFGNSIMAEKARLDTAMADRMKSNFMSTVSHELRSPLHGVLASAELLKDTLTTPAQIDLISMINICGRTLLDTINHVLDFTELNRLRKSKSSEQKTAGDRDGLRKRSQAPSSGVSSITNADLSILIEEVVESTLAGHHFGQSESASMLSLDPQLPSSELGTRSQADGSLVRTHSRVKVILDIDWRSNWVFAFQPGALQRILMNLFSNALKYTKAGHVCVSLKSIPAVSKQDSRPWVILTVSDTGEGISKHFLKHHVFTPFVQEDSLATGTGLGLNIVEQIVHDLNGQIDIKSEKGIGTQVTVQIPLAVPNLKPALLNTNSDNAYLEIVRRKMKGLKVCLVTSRHASESGKSSPVSGQKISESSAAAAMSLEKSLCKTLTHWFELEIVEALPIGSADADVYILLEDESSAFGTQTDSDSLAWTQEIVELAMKNKLIVLSTAPTFVSSQVSEMRKVVQFIQQPFGPHKISRAFNAFFAQKAVPTIQPSLSQPDSLSVAADKLPLGNAVMVTSTREPIFSAMKTQETDIDSNSDTQPSAHTTTALAHITENTQLPIHLQSPIVLLVEDNEINLKLLIMYMRKLNYPYQTAVNGLEALQAYKENPLPLRFILMDISMPVMDGLTSTQEIRRHERENKIAPATIIAITGASSVDAREKAMMSGVDKFLTKPVLLGTVREIIEGRPKREEEQP